MDDYDLASEVDENPVAAWVNLALEIAKVLFKDTEVGKVLETISPLAQIILPMILEDDDTEEEQNEPLKDNEEKGEKEKMLPKEDNSEHGDPTGGASNIDESKQIEQENDSLNNNIKLEATITKEERIKKMMYPDEIAGVKRGKPKTFEQMTQQVINPKLYSEEDVNGMYSNNCACCTVTGELIIRGYDIEAGPADTPIAKELGKAHISAYLDPKTGEECVPQKINIDEVDCFDYLDKNVKQGERYEFSYYTQRNLFYGESNENAYNNQKTQGHVVLITRNEKNELVWYDPQDGDGHKGASDVKAFLNSWVNERTLFDPRILRIDDKALNLKYVNAVVRKRN